MAWDGAHHHHHHHDYYHHHQAWHVVVEQCQDLHHQIIINTIIEALTPLLI